MAKKKKVNNSEIAVEEVELSAVPILSSLSNLATNIYVSGEYYQNNKFTEDTNIDKCVDLAMKIISRSLEKFKIL